MKALVLLPLLLLSWTAQARLSPDWLDAPALAPNVRVLIHKSSLEQTASTVVVQKLENSDSRVQKLFIELQHNGGRVEDLSPHECYELNRKDLSSNQTWCRSQAGDFYAFIQLGPQKMSESELLQVQLTALEKQNSRGTKK